MTLQDAKDEIAKKYGYDEWEFKIHENGYEFVEKMLEEAAELYARSKQAEAWDEGRKVSVSLTNNAINPYKP